MKVRSADGSNLGKVVACEPDTFIIEKGWFFHREYRARYDQVVEAQGDELWLRDSDQQLNAAAQRGEGLAGGEAIAGRETIAGSAQARSGQPEPDLSAGMTEEVRVPLVEEELTAEKHWRQAGEVKIHKDAITEEREITVPVTHEEVRVERVAASSDARPSDANFEETVTNVPVYEEQVEIHKRPVVREEVRVTKTAHEERERLGTEVRKERADIRTEGNVPRPSR
jgi:uncharacterized protein (TIGR02271 family)